MHVKDNLTSTRMILRYYMMHQTTTYNTIVKQSLILIYTKYINFIPFPSLPRFSIILVLTRVPFVPHLDGFRVHGRHVTGEGWWVGKASTLTMYVPMGCFVANVYTFHWTLFKSITLLCGIHNILRNILHVQPR